MFYSQTCENIKLIIFTLDGGLLDLNRLRYNYYRSTCETYHKVATREDFSKMLGNMNTMYDHSLLSDYIFCIKILIEWLKRIYLNILN